MTASQVIRCQKVDGGYWGESDKEELTLQFSGDLHILGLFGASLSSTDNKMDFCFSACSLIIFQVGYSNPIALSSDKSIVSSSCYNSIRPDIIAQETHTYPLDD